MSTTIHPNRVFLFGEKWKHVIAVHSLCEAQLKSVKHPKVAPLFCDSLTVVGDVFIKVKGMISARLTGKLIGDQKCFEKVVFWSVFIYSDYLYGYFLVFYFVLTFYFMWLISNNISNTYLKMSIKHCPISKCDLLNLLVFPYLILQVMSSNNRQSTIITRN